MEDETLALVAQGLVISIGAVMLLRIFNKLQEDKIPDKSQSYGLAV